MKTKLLAVFAGCLGAAASVTGKLGMNGDHINKLCLAITLMFQSIAHDDPPPLTDEEVHMTFIASVVIRGIFLILTFILNATMWSLFVESMQGLNSGEAVVLNTGANILFSALLGRLVFNEMFGMLWGVGASLILCGMSFLHSTTPQEGLKNG